MARNEGEGNRTAARQYNKATTQFARSGRVGAAAKRAEQALDGPEGESLRAAEKVGRAKARSKAATRGKSRTASRTANGGASKARNSAR